jgi:hypothetical protein
MHAESSITLRRWYGRTGGPCDVPFCRILRESSVFSLPLVT